MVTNVTDKIKTSSWRSTTYHRNPWGDYIAIAFSSGSFVIFKVGGGVVVNYTGYYSTNSYLGFTATSKTNKMYVSGSEGGAIFSANLDTGEVKRISTGQTIFSKFNGFENISNVSNSGAIQGLTTDELGDVYFSTITQDGGPRIIKIDPLTDAFEVVNLFPMLEYETIWGRKYMEAAEVVSTPANTDLDGLYVKCLVNKDTGADLLATIRGECVTAGVSFSFDQYVYIHWDDLVDSPTKRRVFTYVDGTAKIIDLYNATQYLDTQVYNQAWVEPSQWAGNATWVNELDASQTVTVNTGDLSTFAATYGVTIPSHDNGIMINTFIAAGPVLYQNNYSGGKTQFHVVPYRKSDGELLEFQTIDPYTEYFNNDQNILLYEVDFNGSENYGYGTGTVLVGNFLNGVRTDPGNQSYGFVDVNTGAFIVHDFSDSASNTVRGWTVSSVTYDSVRQCVNMASFNTGTVQIGGQEYHNDETKLVFNNDYLVNVDMVFELGDPDDPADPYTLVGYTTVKFTDKGNNSPLIEKTFRIRTNAVISDVSDAAVMNDGRLILAGVDYAGSVLVDPADSYEQDFFYGTRLSPRGQKYNPDRNEVITYGYFSKIVVLNTLTGATWEAEVSVNELEEAALLSSQYSLLHGHIRRTAVFVEDYGHFVFLDSVNRVTFLPANKPRYLDHVDGNLKRIDLGLTSNSHTDIEVDAAIAAELVERKNADPGNSDNYQTIANELIDTAVWRVESVCARDTGNMVLSLSNLGYAGLRGISVGDGADGTGTPRLTHDKDIATTKPHICYLSPSDVTNIQESDYALIELAMETAGVIRIGRVACTSTRVAFFYSDDNTNNAYVKVVSWSNLAAAAAGGVLNSWDFEMTYDLGANNQSGYGWGTGGRNRTKLDKSNFYTAVGETIYATIKTAVNVTVVAVDLNNQTFATVCDGVLANRSLHYNPTAGSAVLANGAQVQHIDVFPPVGVETLT